MNKCPFCGSERDLKYQGSGVVYQCGTYGPPLLKTREGMVGMVYDQPSRCQIQELERKVERVRRDHEAMDAIRAHGWQLIRCVWDDGGIRWQVHDCHGQVVWIDGKCNRDWDDPVRAIEAAEAAGRDRDLPHL